MPDEKREAQKWRDHAAYEQRTKQEPTEADRLRAERDEYAATAKDRSEKVSELRERERRLRAALREIAQEDDAYLFTNRSRREIARAALDDEGTERDER